MHEKKQYTKFANNSNQKVQPGVTIENAVKQHFHRAFQTLSLKTSRLSIITESLTLFLISKIQFLLPECSASHCLIFKMPLLLWISLFCLSLS